MKILLPNYNIKFVIRCKPASKEQEELMNQWTDRCEKYTLLHGSQS